MVFWVAHAVGTCPVGERRDDDVGGGDDGGLVCGDAGGCAGLHELHGACGGGTDALEGALEHLGKVKGAFLELVQHRLEALLVLGTQVGRQAAHHGRGVGVGEEALEGRFAFSGELGHHRTDGRHEGVDDAARTPCAPKGRRQGRRRRRFAEFLLERQNLFVEGLCDGLGGQALHQMQAVVAEGVVLVALEFLGDASVVGDPQADGVRVVAVHEVDVRVEPRVVSDSCEVLLAVEGLGHGHDLLRLHAFQRPRERSHRLGEG